MEILSLVISIISVAICVISYCCHDHKLKILEKKVLEQTLKQFKEEEECHKKAQLSIKITTGNYGNGKLLIYNDGKSIARNIRVSNYDKTKLCINEPDVLPFEFLNPNENIPIDITIFEGGKLNISIEWDDDFATNQCNKQILFVE